MRRRLLITALAASLAVTFAAPAGAQEGQGGTTEQFIPFVTDFGRKSFSTPATQSTPTPAPTATAGLDWTDAAIGAALGFGLAAGLGAVGAAVLVRRGGPGGPRRGRFGRPDRERDVAAGGRVLHS
jgi:hypothetical protein